MTSWTVHSVLFDDVKGSMASVIMWKAHHCNRLFTFVSVDFKLWKLGYGNIDCYTYGITGQSTRMWQGGNTRYSNRKVTRWLTLDIRPKGIRNLSHEVHPDSRVTDWPPFRKATPKKVSVLVQMCREGYSPHYESLTQICRQTPIASPILLLIRFLWTLLFGISI